jgi:hypothetical protein
MYNDFSLTNIAKNAASDHTVYIPLKEYYYKATPR